nr:exodeoxyribonuclease V subunit alpha [Comamonas jiangduensis]
MSRKRTRDTTTLDMFAEAVAHQPLTPALTLDVLRDWADAGMLRRLDVALAAWVLEQDAQATPCTLVAVTVLAQMEGGHSCLPLAQLVNAPNAVLGWEAQEQPALQALWAQLPLHCHDWLVALQASPLVRVMSRHADHGQPLVLAASDSAQPLLYLRRYWDHERTVASHILQRSQARPVALDATAARKWLDAFFPPSGAEDCNWQKVACALALRGHFSVITGGPGTGKTYTAARLLALLFATAPNAAQLRVALAAPTGKAAARLKQSIESALHGLQASVGDALDLPGLVQRVGAARTLHALLGARPDTRHWGYHAGRPLDVDVLIVDEASMVHLEMMSALLEALPPTARLILLGDKDQLASVEAGAVLGDLCRDAAAGRYGADTVDFVERVAGERIPADFHAPAAAPALAQHTAMLRASRRFAGRLRPWPRPSMPVMPLPACRCCRQKWLRRGCRAHCHAEDGRLPFVHALAWLGRGDAPGYSAYAQALQRWAQVQPRSDLAAAHPLWVREVLQAFDRFRLLCAVREGAWGVAGLNQAVVATLRAQGVIAAEGEWYAGRPVMVQRNDAALGLFNGDIGMALPSAAPGHGLRVYFLQGEELRSVSVARLAPAETAFAMPVPKSQGPQLEQADIGNHGQPLAHAGPVKLPQLAALARQHPLPQGVAQNNAAQQTPHKHGQLQPRLVEQRGDHAAQHQRHVQPQPGAQHAVVVQRDGELLVGHAHIQRPGAAAVHGVAAHQVAGNRAADGAGRNHAHHVAGHAQLDRIRDPQALDEDRPPGQRSAHATGQGDGAGHQPGARIQPEQLRHPHAQQVLQHDEQRGQRQQDQQRLAALLQGAQVRAQADGCEEVQQQGVAHVQVELDARAQQRIRQAHHAGAQKTANHRLRHAVAAHHAPVCGDLLSGKEQQDGQGEALEGGDVQGLGQGHGGGKRFQQSGRLCPATPAPASYNRVAHPCSRRPAGQEGACAASGQSQLLAATSP